MMKKIKPKYIILLGIIFIIILYNIIYTTDPEKPDTFGNILFFESIFKMKIPEDVKDLYCYSEPGFDPVNQLKFTCDSNTVYRIIQNLGLEKGEKLDAYSFGIWRPFPNWNLKKLENIVPFIKTDDSKRIYWYLFYDKNNKEVYYINYDM